MKQRILIVISVIIIALSLIPKSITAPVFSENRDPRLLVLMYHSVLDTKAKKYVVSTEKLESDILWLQNEGYSPVSVKDLIKYVYSGGELPEKPVLLTFDDGMLNNMTNALPILAKHGFHGVFSIVGSYTDEYTRSGVSSPYYSYLTWDNINELAVSPYIELASHSYDFHTITAKRNGVRKNKGESTLDYITAFYEDTQKMQSAFSANCNLSPYIYTYPFGTYSRESSRVLHKMKFLVTLSCNEGMSKITRGDPDCLYLIKRYNRDGRLNSSEFFKSIGL